MKTYNVTLANNANVWMRTNSSYLTFNTHNDIIDSLTNYVNEINDSLSDLKRCDAPVNSTIWLAVSNHIELLQLQLGVVKHNASACVSFDGDELVRNIEKLQRHLEAYKAYADSKFFDNDSYAFYEEPEMSDCEIEGIRDWDYEEHVDDHYNV